MECPFCTGKIKHEAIVCSHCARDLRVVRPVLLEIDELTFKLDEVRQELDRTGARLKRLKYPIRCLITFSVSYVFVPVIFLVIAHALVTIVFNIQPIYLRLASVIIPIPFGAFAYAISRLGLRAAFLLGIMTATISVTLMLVVTGVNDDVPILPASRAEWREVAEYIASIFLAFVTGNILAISLLRVLPGTLSGGGRPNSAAYRLARVFGPNVGEDELRKRARAIQDLVQSAGPVAGMAATAIGSIYTGLKGVIGQ
jgi:hypothetical protein